MKAVYEDLKTSDRVILKRLIESGDCSMTLGGEKLTVTDPRKPGIDSPFITQIHIIGSFRTWWIVTETHKDLVEYWKK